jgi:hypothetical protein
MQPKNQTTLKKLYGDEVKEERLEGISMIHQPSASWCSGIQIPSTHHD